MTSPRRLALRACLLLAGLLLTLPLHAQDVPLEVDAISVRGPSGTASRLDVYTKVSYGALTFRRAESGYRARYRVSLDVYRVSGGRQGAYVRGKTWDRTVTASNYEATVEDRFHDRTTQALDLEPGRYLLQFAVEDDASSRRYAHEVTAIVADLSGSPAVSDLILVDSYDAAEASISPRVSSAIGTDERTFSFFYEIYSDAPREVRVVREVHRQARRSLVRTALGMEQDEATSATYATVAPTRLRAGRNPVVVTIPLEGFRVGDYTVRVRVESLAGDTLATREKPVEVLWTGLDQHIRDLDGAIAQLVHIAKPRDIDHIREGESTGERLRRFRAFWERLDPTPGTARNERMEEYYLRVAHANRSYKAGARDGWQTDRGLVMVTFGEPSDVTRHPFSFGNKPYEVWTYDHIGRRFIFIDDTGFGDYRLLHPIWDDRTRL
jgi:GWxTD domain-containing protein